MINNYPLENLNIDAGLTYGDYANPNAGLLNFFGRAGKSMVMRAGRVSAQHAIEQQGALFGTAALMAAKLLPTSTKLKMILEAQMQDRSKSPVLLVYDNDVIVVYVVRSVVNMYSIKIGLGVYSSRSIVPMPRYGKFFVELGTFPDSPSDCATGLVA